MLESLYNLDIDYRQIHTKIRKFWKSWDNALKLFFKPILQHLLEHEFNWDEIVHTLRRHPSYRVKTNFKKWFFGLNVTQLKYVIKRDDFSRKNLEEIASDVFEQLGDENKIKGVLKDDWIEWLVKDKGMDILANELDYKNIESFRSSWIKQNRESIFQREFAPTYKQAVRKFRKIRTLLLLTDDDFVATSLGNRLYWIYINEFGFTRWEDLAVPRPSQGLRNCRVFFDKLFNDEGLNFYHLESIDASDSKLLNNLL